jgi:outer membrane protein
MPHSVSLKYALCLAALTLSGCSILGLGKTVSHVATENQTRHGQFYPQAPQHPADFSRHPQKPIYHRYVQMSERHITPPYQSNHVSRTPFPFGQHPSQPAPYGAQVTWPASNYSRPNDPSLNTPYWPRGSAQTSIQNAVSQSGLIESKRLEIKEAQEGYIQARAASLPSFDFGGSLGFATRQSNSSVASIEDISTSQETGSVRAGISQVLYAGGQNKAQKKRAQASIAAAQQDLRATTSDVVLDSVRTHLDVIRTQNILALHQRSVANLEAQKTATNLLFEYGEATVADVSLVEARLQTTKIEAGQAQLRFSESHTNYQFLTGDLPGKLAPPKFERLPASLDQALDLALSRNPDVLRAQADWDIAESDLDIAKANRLPTLSLDGSVSESLGQSDFVASSSAATVSMNLRVPFSLGGQHRSKVKQAIHVLSRRKLDGQQAVINLRRDITLKWNALQIADYSINLREKEIAASDAAFRSLKDQFQSGVTTQSELLSAESDLLSAHIRLEDAQYQEQILRAELLDLLGSLDIAGQTPYNVSPPANIRPAFWGKRSQY